MTRLITTLTLLSLAACSPHYVGPTEDEELARSRAYVDGTEEADLVLRAANELTLDELDHDAALDVRAADGIVDLRPFATIAALDAVPWVGGCALDNLYDIAVERFGTEPLTEEEEEALILQAANTLSLEVLDDDVPLDARAAQNIVDQRPFDTLAELDAVSYVGPSALGKLLDWALQEWGVLEECPEGAIFASTGAEYTDLADAARRSPDGTVLTLCAGTYVVSDVVIEQDLTLQGQGSDRTLIRGSGHVLYVDRSDVVLRDLAVVDSTDPYGVVYGNGGSITLDGVSIEGNSGVAMGMWDSDLVAMNGTRFVDNTGLAIETWHADVTSTGTLFADNDTAIDIQGGGRTYRFESDSFHNNDGPDGAVVIAFEWGDATETASFSDVDFGIGATENATHDLTILSGNGGTVYTETFDYLSSGTTLLCTYDDCEG